MSVILFEKLFFCDRDLSAYILLYALHLADELKPCSLQTVGKALSPVISTMVAFSWPAVKAIALLGSSQV